MAIPITEQADALIEFKRLARPDECPELTSGEQLAILTSHKRGVLWTANTVRELGSGLAVIPTLANRNGHRFVAVRYITTGTNQQNGATEPVWGTGQGSEYTDGNVIWREDGWDWDAVCWNFVAAAEEAWLAKMGKATLKTKFQLPYGMSVSASDIFDHCEKMSKRFRSVSVA